MNKLKQYLKKAYRFLKWLLKVIYILGSRKILNFHDWFVDRRICGRSLVKEVPNISGDEKKETGGTGTQSTSYACLKRIFSHVELSPSDKLMDIGCGKGRVLAFLMNQKRPCELYGIEYNHEVAKFAQEWSARFPQIHIIAGDAFQEDFNQYTVLTFARALYINTHLLFIQRLEETLHHPIRFVSWWEDRRAYRFMKDRPGWHIEYRDRIDRIHGLRLAYYAEYFTVWTYDPDERKQRLAAGEAERAEA